VKVIADGEGSAFDPEVVRTFRRVVFPYPVGTEVDLPDGRVGVVSRVDPEEPDVPVIRVPGADGPEEIAVDIRTGLAP
jgi:HD-GYP domain-containing protein (c-di-GMP phosphodiesterase class II)